MFDIIMESSSAEVVVNQQDVNSAPPCKRAASSAIDLSRKGDLAGLQQLQAAGQLPTRIERCRLAMYAASKAGHQAVVDWWLHESGMKFNQRSRQAVAVAPKSPRQKAPRTVTAAADVDSPAPALTEVPAVDAAWLKRLQTQCSSVANSCSSEAEALSFTNGFYLGVISNMRRSRARK